MYNPVVLYHNCIEGWHFAGSFMCLQITGVRFAVVL